MYTINVTKSFDAAHRLEGYKGPCSNLHGHRWVVKASWSADKLNKVGMTADLVQLKKELVFVLQDLDHAYLNKVRALGPKPTAENIARLVFTRLTKRNIPCTLTSVNVEETEGCSITYYGELGKSHVLSPVAVMHESAMETDAAVAILTEQDIPDGDVDTKTAQEETSDVDTASE